MWRNESLAKTNRKLTENLPKMTDIVEYSISSLFEEKVEEPVKLLLTDVSRVPVEKTRNIKNPCVCVKPDGTRCRNAAKIGTDKCSSHSRVKKDKPESYPCPVVKADGTPCKCFCMHGKKTCKAHTPKEAKEKQPRCSCFTTKGEQCRNSCKTGENMCSSHCRSAAKKAQTAA